MNTSAVPLTAAAIERRVGVEPFRPKPARRDPHTILLPDHRREVAHDQQQIVGAATTAEKANHTVQRVAAMLRAQLADAEVRVRMARLLGELLSVTEAVTALNYGHARELSSTFFDGVRAEAARTPVPSFKTALESILQRRDGVTAALSRSEQEAAELLRTSQMQLREALGYSVARPA